MLQLNRPLIFLDFESTWTNPQEDRIVEMCLVKINTDGTRIVKTYLINPEMPIPASATEIHKISNEQVKDQPTFKQLSKALFDFLQGSDLAGFKSNMFDFPLLYAEFRRVGITWNYKNHNLIDVGNIFQIKESRTLSAAVKFYCDKELEGAHGAEADILATISVFERQLERYEDLPRTIEDIAVFSNYGNIRLDMAGKFIMDKDGTTVLLNFGQNKGQPAKDNISFLNWMATKDFPPDTMEIVQSFLKW